MSNQALGRGEYIPQTYAQADIWNNLVCILVVDGVLDSLGARLLKILRLDLDQVFNRRLVQSQRLLEFSALVLDATHEDEHGCSRKSFMLRLKKSTRDLGGELLSRHVKLGSVKNRSKTREKQRVDASMHPYR